MHNTKDFETIVNLIEEARSRAFQKVNQELVMLYFNVGSLVSAKVSKGVWGDGTVNELAGFIQSKYPELQGKRMNILFFPFSIDFLLDHRPSSVQTLSCALKGQFNSAQRQRLGSIDIPKPLNRPERAA